MPDAASNMLPYWGMLRDTLQGGAYPAGNARFVGKARRDQVEQRRGTSSGCRSKYRLLEDGDQALLAQPEPGVFDHDVDPTLADAFLRDPRHHIVAAIKDQRIVGFVSAVDYFHPDKPRELWINEVGVARRLQRQGIGAQLMRATLDHARALGCVEAWVLTDRRNSAATALYRKICENQEGTDQIMFEFILSNLSKIAR